MGFAFTGQLVAVRQDTKRETGLPSGYTTIGVLGMGTMKVQRFYAKNGECTGTDVVEVGEQVTVQCTVFPKPPRTQGGEPELSCRAIAIAIAAADLAQV